MALQYIPVFLDAFKTFDRVNRWKRFHKLIIRKVMLLIV